MTAPLSSLQAAIYSYLIADSALTALLAAGAGSLLDHVSPGTAFPYAALGEMTQTPVTTQDSAGYDITLNIHSFSRYHGFTEIQNIMGAVSSALDNVNLPVSGYRLVLCQPLESSTLLEDDGETRRSLQRFRFVLEPL